METVRKKEVDRVSLTAYFRGSHAPLLVLLALLFLSMGVPAAHAATQQRTTEWFVFQSMNQSIADNQQINATFTVTVPESSPAVRSAFAEVTVGFVTGATTVLAGSHICINANSNCTLFAGGPTESGELQFYTFLANVTGYFQQNITAPGNFTQNLTIRLNQSSMARPNLLSAKLYLTYDYDDSSTTQMKTVRFFAGQRADTLVSGATNVFDLAPLNLPESGVTVRSAFFEIRGQKNNDVTTNAILNISLDSVQNLTSGTSFSINNTAATVTSWLVLYNVSYDPTQSHTLSFKNQAGTIISGLNAELVLTYEYDNSTSPTQLKTVEHFIGQDTVSGGLTQLNFTSNASIPEENITLRNAYVRVREGANGTTAGMNLSIRAFMGAEGGSINIGPYDGGAETTGGVVALYNATGDLGDGNLTHGENNVTCQVQSITQRGASPGCFLVVTYTYNASSRTQIKTTQHFVGTGVTAAAAGRTKYTFSLNVPETLFIFNNVTLDTAATSAASPTSLFSNISIGAANNTQTCKFGNSGEVLVMRCWDDVSDLVNSTGSFTAFAGANVNNWPSSKLILTYTVFKPFVQTFNTTAFVDVITNFSNDQTVFSRAQHLSNGSKSYRFSYRNASGDLLCQNTNSTSAPNLTNRTDATGCSLSTFPSAGLGNFNVGVERVERASFVLEANATFLVIGATAPTTPTVAITSPANATKPLFQNFEVTRTGEPSLPKDFFIINTSEFADDDSAAWPYPPLISTADTNYLLVNATPLKSAGLWPASRAVEVAPNTDYVLSFFVSNVTFQGRLQEFGSIWYTEFDENTTEQDHGDMVIFNSTHAWTDHPQLFTVGRKPISEWTKINVSFTTSPDTRYMRFEPSFQNVRSNSFYYIDNIEVARR